MIGVGVRVPSSAHKKETFLTRRSLFLCTPDASGLIAQRAAQPVEHQPERLVADRFARQKQVVNSPFDLDIGNVRAEIRRIASDVLDIQDRIGPEPVSYTPLTLPTKSLV